MTISIELLERTIYAHLVNAIVAAGYLPDRSLYTDEIDFENARAQIRANKGFIIDLYSVTSPLAKEGKNDVKIVILRRNTAQGNIGASNTTFYKENNGRFDKYLRRGNTRTFPFEFRTIGNIVSAQRVMEQILYDTYGSASYLPVLDSFASTKVFDPKKKFLFVANGGVDVSVGQMTEKIYMYNALDIFVEKPVKILEDIPPVTEITSGIGTAKDLNNPTQEEIDNLILFKRKK